VIASSVVVVDAFVVVVAFVVDTRSQKVAELGTPAVAQERKIQTADTHQKAVEGKPLVDCMAVVAVAVDDQTW
jgi:hypothetical protein